MYLNVCAYWTCIKLQKKYRRKMCGAVFSLFLGMVLVDGFLGIRLLEFSVTVLSDFL
jgi:hypothetical protein